MASDVLAVMNEMSIDKASFIGWSDGGIISLEIAINHPERISRALTIGTNYNLSGIDHAVEENAAFGEYVGKAAELYAQLSATPDEFEGFVGDVTQMWSTQPDYSEDQLASISAPFTVVQAIEDEAVIDEHAEKMASLMSNTTYMPVEGVSHFAIWQEPQKINQTISEFLAAK